MAWTAAAVLEGGTDAGMSIRVQVGSFALMRRALSIRECASWVAMVSGLQACAGEALRREIGQWRWALMQRAAVHLSRLVVLLGRLFWRSCSDSR